MVDNYEHYITRNIKAFYTRRLFSPIIYISILIILWFVFPLGNLLFPASLTGKGSLDSIAKSSDGYVKASLEDLHFTGYTEISTFGTKGYYYYCTVNDQVAIVLLSPSTCDEGNPAIDSVSIHCQLIKGGTAYTSLLNNLASDLDWTTNGITSQVSKYYLSEPDYHLVFIVFLFIFYFGSLAYALFSLILYAVYSIFPFLSPTCQNLILFGHPRKMLEQAEEELATLPQLATEDMFITENFFILTSPMGNAIIPIQEILWIYKYSTLHKFLWYHFSISYTLNICASKHLFIKCPKNAKSDIDGIMDYLSEANHNILVGFNEENRLKLQAVQGKPLHIERWMAFLRHKV